MDYQHYNTFNLTDPITGKTKNIYDDFGGLIINTNETYYERECVPQVNFITDKNDTRDGEIFINAYYGTRVIEMTCFFSEEQGGGDLFELKRWLYKSRDGRRHRQWFEWEGDDENKHILVYESGGFQSKAYYQKKFYGELTFKFIAHNSFYSIKDEKDIVFNNLVTNNITNIRCAGNSESFPLIKITPNGTQSIIQFQWNDLLITLSNVDKPIYLDCELNQTYEYVNGILTPVNTKYSSTKYIDYPYITSDADEKNILKILNGNISEFRISPRSRIL
jgi:phage-related protein